VGEAGVPAAEVAGEVVVEDPGADLEQQVGAAGAPARLATPNAEELMQTLKRERSRQLFGHSPRSPD